MSHLLGISVGPVQEFIAAARRTRDLWFGSYLLSEISRAVAKSVEADGGKLIFPASSDAESVANVILVELPSGDPETIADQAKDAAINCWRQYADRARRDAGNAVRQDFWDLQVRDVIEFYAAWVAHVDPNMYSEDRKKLVRLLAGRKACRDFPAQQYKDAGVPKSSLDGQRPSVLVQPERHGQREQLRESWPKLLRLSKGEELDIVGVTKRLGRMLGESHPGYASVARIAAESWLQEKRNHSKFEQFKDVCETIPGLNRVREPAFQYFPFEGTVVYKNRHSDFVDELGDEAKPYLKEVARLLRELGGEPNPYLAVLIADGDKMGAAISNLKTREENQRFSKDLAGFADEARTIVTKHNGALIYAGGDDVLAFLPVDQALGCARKLHEDFGTRLAKYGQPTLSVGIAIGHFMENLEDLLEYGRAAEKAAKKPDRDGLAVHLYKRGGAPIQIRARWSDSPDQRLERFARLMNDGIIPTKIPYELRSMAKVYEQWPNADAAIQQDLFRLIAKKASRSETTVQQVLSEDIRELDSAKLSNLAEELLVARMIASALRQSKSRKEVTA